MPFSRFKALPPKNPLSEHPACHFTQIDQEYLARRREQYAAFDCTDTRHGTVAIGHSRMAEPDSMMSMTVLNHMMPDTAEAFAHALLEAVDRARGKSA